MLAPSPLMPPIKGALPASPIPRHDSKVGTGMLRCLDAVAPAILKARTQVRHGAEALAKSYPNVPFDPITIDHTLASPLAQQLVMMMTRVMVLELNVARLEGVLAGETPKERFDSFVERLRNQDAAAELLSEYPVLVEQIVNRLDKWAAFSLEFLKHLFEDWSSLKQFFGVDAGALVSISGGAGDTHREGRSVMIATFADGSRLVYKPRSLAVDAHFQQLLKWLNDRGANHQFRLTRILNRGCYGWSEFIPATGCGTEAEIRRFYARQGGFLALFYALNATDLHYENVIAAGDHPIVIDLEALFHQSVEDSFEHSDPSASALWRSVVRVGLLPMRSLVSEDYSGIDVGGLSNPAGQFSPRAALSWDRVDTDEMHAVRRRIEMGAGKNCPKLNGQDVSAFDYAESVLAGFSSMYRLLLTDRAELSDLLASFAEDEVRFIARPTRTYAALLFESFHPDLLRDSAERIALFGRLREGGAQRHVLDRLVTAECNDLLRGDIPLFTTRPSSRHLWTSDGECIHDVFNESAIALVNGRLSELSEGDLQHQLWTVRASIATLSPDLSRPRGLRSRNVIEELPSEADVSSAHLIRTACELGDRFEQHARTGSEGTNWLGLVALDEQQRRVFPLGLDLYDGLPGVIFFLAHLGAISGRNRYLDLAKSGLKTLQRRIDAQRAGWGGVGGFTGWGGVIYALSHLSVILCDSSLAATAESLLDSLADPIGLDKDLDIIGGAAGCAIALRSLQQTRPSAKVIETTRACGERLLQTARQTEHGLGWIYLGNAEFPLTGFAHGNAGIAYSLLTIAELTNEARFRDAACAAIEYERAVFSPEHANWPDFRRNSIGGFATAWCHGAPGIGLSRLCSLRALDDPLLRDEIDTALATTVSTGFRESHIICHGNFGNVDILLYAAEILQDPRWNEHAKHQAGRILTAAKGGNWVLENPLNVETPGLMTGLAGIGYALLRLADPARVPCILALDPPKVQG